MYSSEDRRIVAQEYQEEFGDGERLGEHHTWPFRRYFDRWVKFWPRTPFHVKSCYARGFFQRHTTKGRPLFLTEALQAEVAERHLEPDRYRMWTIKEDRDYQPRYGERHWLALHAPRKTTVDCIDLDAKSYLLAYHRRGFSEESPLLPVVCPTVEHFRAIKAIYDHFPGRVWCISSETLGLHIWRKHPRPVVTEDVQSSVKRGLTSLGLGHVEVHPMKGRCLRRPFGEDYRTITPEGILEDWVRQSDYFEDDGRTPSFRTIVDSLVQAIRLRRDFFRNAYHQFSVHQKPILDFQVSRLIEDRLTQIERWIAEGFPSDIDQEPGVADSEPIPPATSSPSSSPPPSTSLPTIKGPPEQPTYTPSLGDRPSENVCEPRPTSSTNRAPYEGVVIRASDMRDGRWATDLEIVARVGLMEEDSVGPMLHELAKWLYWVELFDLKEADRKGRVRESLVHFVETKHNGFITRWNNGDHESVFAQIDSCLESAIRLDRDHRPRSLELFCRLRQKRQQDAYVRNILLEPILDTSLLSPSSSPSTYLLTNKEPNDDLIPPTLEEKILAVAKANKMRKKEGDYPFARFARRMLNELWSGQGRARIRLETIHAFLGNSSTHQQQRYKKLMAANGLIEWGWERTIRRKKASATYKMTGETIGRFEERHRMLVKVV